MLIEFIKDKEPKSLEIGCRYLTRPGCIGLSPNKVIQIKGINKYEVVYIYTTGSPGGNFTRPKKEVERSVILSEYSGGKIE